MPTLQVIRMQLPVGQGGLHSTVLRARGSQFWFVYDCGSSNRSALWRELEQLDVDFDDQPLDLLVLSHLDEDHVNGVERLLARREVRHVAIPYLVEEDKVLLLARAAAENALTESNASLFVNPAAWFAARGVGTVIRVGSPRGSSPPPPPPDAPEWPLPELLADGPSEWALDGPVETLEVPAMVDAGRGATKRIARRVAPVQLDLPAGAPLVVRSGRDRLWELVPFWYQHEDVSPFVRKVRSQFGLTGKITTKKLRPILASPEHRRKLAALYQAYFRDRNWTSLCLYAGPAFRSGGDTRCYGERGWLQTGDAPLSTKKYQKEFLRYFAARLQSVDVVVLPHHGSRRSFPRQGLPGLQPDLWIAAAGKNGYGHPDPGLRTVLRRMSSFHQVSTCRTSLYNDHFVAFRPGSSK